MIAKDTQGASGRALIRYLFGPGRGNEHSDQRVITSGIVMGVEEGRSLSPSEIAELGAALDAANDVYRNNPAGGHIWHLSLSLPAGDRQLTDDQWAEIAHKTVEALGFESQGTEPAAWVAVGHGISANGNQHIHIAASLVRGDGLGVNLWQSKRTLSRVCAELEQTYGLTVVGGREGRGMPGLSRAELERAAREHLAEPPRITLVRLVRAASVASKDEAEFVRRLRASGALVRPRFETGGKAVVGYSIALRAKDGVAPIWFGGGKLARDLTLPKLRQFWEGSTDDRRAAVAEWSATTSVARGREAMVGSPADWQRALFAMERTLEGLKGIPVSDLVAWRGAAREASGLFAAWSRRVEGDSPGPLAAGATALARSAQYRPSDSAPNRDAVRDLRGIAAIVTQSQLNKDSPIVWAMMIDQLRRTLRAVGDAHMARGEMEVAKSLVGNLSNELEALHDRLQKISLRELTRAARLPKSRLQARQPTFARPSDHHRRRCASRESGIERS